MQSLEFYIGRKCCGAIWPGEVVTIRDVIRVLGMTSELSADRPSGPKMRALQKQTLRQQASLR
jgi:hypothetical protein